VAWYVGASVFEEHSSSRYRNVWDGMLLRNTITHKTAVYVSADT
jgi:hypothetical protein